MRFRISSETLISLRVVGGRRPTGAARRRRASFMTFCGATTLPSDLDILRPFSSTVKPWVSTPWYGAGPSGPREVSSELWNQPRCWSEPSRYRSAGSADLRPACGEHAVVRDARVHPDVHDVRDLLVVAGVRTEQLARDPGRTRRRCHSCSTRSATPRPVGGASGCSSPVSRCMNSGIGTPQVRWREMHQSGRPAIMPSMRCLAPVGDPLAPCRSPRARRRAGRPAPC